MTKLNILNMILETELCVPTTRHISSIERSMPDDITKQIHFQIPYQKKRDCFLKQSPPQKNKLKTKILLSQSR